MAMITSSSCANTESSGADTTSTSADSTTASAPVKQEDWGEFDGKKVSLFTLTNKNGTEVKITN